jgi:hypothetical protein
VCVFTSPHYSVCGSGWLIRFRLPDAVAFIVCVCVYSAAN